MQCLYIKSLSVSPSLSLIVDRTAFQINILRYELSLEDYYRIP